MKHEIKKMALMMIAAVLWANAARANPGDYMVLHSFAGGASDGGRPVSGLIQGAGTLYGMTPYGGACNRGAVFALDPAGEGYEQLHSFSGPDGKFPLGALLLHGTNLFGMTSRGGAENDGVIFRVGTNGLGFTILHHFDGGDTNNGALPWGSLIQSGGVLYGMTFNGGLTNRGTIFRINPDGTGYTNLHRFLGPPVDGKHPKGDLLADGGKLYGLTAQGGSNNMGVVFAMNQDGSGYEVIRHFRASGEGVNPSGNLLRDGGFFYGVTPSGTDNAGAVFRLSTDGKELTWLRQLTGAASDGAAVYSGLVRHDTKLYGAARFGGANGHGILFSLGGSFSNQFAWPLGGEPVGSLLSVGDSILGTAHKGGAGHLGQVFSFEPFTGDVATAWCAITWIDDGGMGETLEGDQNNRRMYLRHSTGGGAPDAAFVGYGLTGDADDATWTWIPLADYGDLGADYEFTGKMARASSGDYYVAAKFIKGRHVYYPSAAFNSWGDWDTGLYATNRWRVTALTAPSDVYAQYISTNRVDVHFKGDGAHWVIVFRKQSAAPDFTDVEDGVEYYVGDDYGARGECVYRGDAALYVDDELATHSVYQYRLYTENWSFYSTGALASASTDPERDDDADQMPNQYEVDQSFNPGLAADGAEDADDDGMANWKEYVSGTNPRDETSFLAIHEGVYDGDGDRFVITWSSVAGKRYALHSTDNPSAGLTNELATLIHATPPQNVWTAAVSGVEKSYFGVRVHR